MDSEEIYDFLLEALIPQLEERGRHWLQDSLSDPELYATLDRKMAAARRKVGVHSFDLSIPVSMLPLSHSYAPPQRQQAGWETIGQDVSDAARGLLLLRCQYGRSEPQELVKEAFRRGDEKERCAIMKWLLLLDPRGSLTSLCVDTCRTNSLDLFSSIAVCNPYAYFFFSEPEFNLLVLKSLFLDLDISHIYGLKERINESLIQMCREFMEERKAAGRPVPGSIRLILS